MRQWDYLHCPPGTHHITVGAGDGPCVILMVGTRGPDVEETEYTVDELAARYGASVAARHRLVQGGLRGSRARATPRCRPRGRRATDVAPGAGTLRRPMAATKRFHVTTFGCQMNEHDSERMKGMLESLGYAEAPAARRGRPHPLQHVLDPRGGRQPLRRPPAPGQGRQARAARRRHRRRRLLGAVGQGRRLPPVPVRRRRLRPGPGPQARRVPDLRLAHRAGLLRVRGLHRPPAGQARPRVPGLGADLGRLQLPLLVLHRALHARARGVAAVRRARRGGPRAGRRRRARGHAARARTSTPTGATCVRTAAPSPSCCTRSTPSTGSTACATRARTPRTCARTSSAPTPSSPRSASTSTCRCSRARARSSRRCAAPTTAAATWTASRSSASTCPTARSPPTSSSASRARPRRTSRRRSRSARRSATTAPSPSSSRRGAGPRRRLLTEGLVPHEVKVERMERLVEVVQRRAARARAALRRAHARRARRGPVAHRRLADPRALAPRQDGELHRPGGARRDRGGRDPLGHEHDPGRRGVAALARGGLAARWRAWRSSASAPSALRWPPPCSPRAATSCCSAGAGRSSEVVVELPDGSAVDGRPRPLLTDPGARRRAGRLGAAGGQGPSDAGRGGLAVGAVRPRRRPSPCCRTASTTSSASARWSATPRSCRWSTGARSSRWRRAACASATPCASRSRPGGGGGAGGAARRTTPRSPSAAPSRCEAWRKLCANAVSGVMALAGRPGGDLRPRRRARGRPRARARVRRGGARRGRRAHRPRRRRRHRVARGAARPTPAPRSSPTAWPAARWNGRRATA